MMSTRLLKLAALACLLVLLIGPAAQVERARADDLRRAIIFIPGMTLDCAGLPPATVARFPGGELMELCDNNDPAGYPSEARAFRVFATIKDRLAQRQGADSLSWHTYSYSPSWQTSPVYSGADTRGAVDVMARLLGDQIRAWGTEGVAYTIVTHSLGGVVAAYWGGSESDPATLAAVRAVVTLDSSVAGVPPADLGIFVGEVGGQAMRDLERPEVMATMRRSVDRLTIINFGNQFDQVVPAALSFLTTCPPEVPCLQLLARPGRLNHWEILEAEPAIDVINRVVSGDVPRRDRPAAGQALPGACPEGAFSPGSLVRTASSPTVYLYADGALHAVPDLPTLYARGLRLDALLTVSEQCLQSLGTGEPLPSVVFRYIPLAAD